MKGPGKGRNRKYIKEFLSTCEEKYLEIIIEYFGFDGGEGVGSYELGEKYKLNPRTIRDIIERNVVGFIKNGKSSGKKRDFNEKFFSYYFSKKQNLTTITHSKSIKKKVLELYSQGNSIQHIRDLLHIGRHLVDEIIAKNCPKNDFNQKQFQEKWSKYVGNSKNN